VTGAPQRERLDLDLSADPCSLATTGGQCSTPHC